METEDVITGFSAFIFKTI